MKLIIYWRWKKSDELEQIIIKSLVDLWLQDIIELEKNNSSKLKEELDIKKTPSLIVDYPEMDFRYTIFEWVSVTNSEINDIILNLIWWNEWIWCSVSKCDTCNFWCNL